MIADHWSNQGKMRARANPVRREEEWTRPMPPTVEGLTQESPPVYEEGHPLPDEEPRPLDAPADWRTVVLPWRVAKLPRDRRGYPMFKTIQPTGVTPEGYTADFRVLNVKTFLEYALSRRCAICGYKLGAKLAFLGGPMCVQRRIFGDGPMHYDCAQYARLVCPFLVNASRQYDQNLPEGMGFDPNVIQKKPERLVLYTCTDFRLLPAGEGKPVCLVRPADSAEWYTASGQYICRTKPTRYVQ